VLPLVISQ